MDGGYYETIEEKSSRKPRNSLEKSDEKTLPTYQKRNLLEKEDQNIYDLSCDFKLRSLKKTMKKVMRLPTLKKVKDLGKKMSRKMIWLMFGGIDALNFHFSNPSLHNSFFDLLMIPMESSEKNSINEHMNTVSKEITGNLNMHMMRLSNQPDSESIKDLIKKCGSLENRTRFVCENKTDSQHVIDLIYSTKEITTEQINGNKKIYREYRTPFVIIRYKQKSDFKTIIDPLDYQGIKFMSICQVYEEVFHKADDFSKKLRKGVSDLTEKEREQYKSEFESWKLRKEQARKILFQSGLTMTCITMEMLTRRCFPLLELDNSQLTGKLSLNDIEYQIRELEIKSESKRRISVLKDYSTAETRKNSSKENIAMKELIYRAVSVGFLPNNKSLLEVLNNDFNSDLLYEIRQTIIGI